MITFNYLELIWGDAFRPLSPNARNVMDFGRGERLVLSKVAMYEVEAIQTDYEETIKYLGIINIFISCILFTKEQKGVSQSSNISWA